MHKTKIEWADYTINPVKGLCPVACDYCYARRMYKRFGWNPEIRMEPDWQEELPKTPAKIFIGSTMELFDDWVEDWMWDSIWQYVRSYPQHTFIFLTKRPENLIKWSPFPENCWVGVSVTDAEDDAPLGRSIYTGFDKVQASVKFISFEPILADVRLDYRDLEWCDVNWLIIGQQTPSKPSTTPKIEWIKEIVEAASKAGIPVFLKNNLRPLFETETGILRGKWWDIKNNKLELRREFPVTR